MVAAPGFRALELGILQRIEHFHLLHHAVKHICTPGLTILQWFKNMDK
jgi:hypothetical protein